mgnify:CR=1 FL=1
MAIAEPCILLPLWKQETHDGTDVPECQLPILSLWDFFYLNKISEKDWVEYICQRFESTGKHISEELAREICQVTDRYSSYVQQLAWFVWLRVQDDSVATEEDLKYGIDRLLDACEPLFIQQTEDFQPIR